MEEFWIKGIIIDTKMSVILLKAASLPIYALEDGYQFVINRLQGTYCLTPW